MPRKYRMRARAEARDQTREKIIRATMALHDRKGISGTTLSEIAQEAGVGPATLYRHFPTLGELVRHCGMHVWQEMRPPVPDAAPAIFADLRTTRARLERLILELDEFYARGGFRLHLAARDRDVLPEVGAFLAAIETGVAALVREALALSQASEKTVGVLLALTRLAVWRDLDSLSHGEAEGRALKLRLLEASIRATADG